MLNSVIVKMADRKARLPEEMVLKVSEEEESHRVSYDKPRREFMKEYKALLKCTKCLKDYEGRIKDGLDIGVHPLLNVFFCEACKDFYGDGDFSMDEGEDKYCRWCGEGGTLFLCSECVHGFCPKCIKRNLGRKILNSAKSDDNWKCFFCNPQPLWLLRYVTAEALKIAGSKERVASSADDDSKSSSKRGTSKKRISSDSEDSSKASVSRKRLKLDSDDDEVKKGEKENVEEVKTVDEADAKSNDSDDILKVPVSKKKKRIVSDDESDDLIESDKEEPEQSKNKEPVKTGNAVEKKSADDEVNAQNGRPSKSSEPEIGPKPDDKPECQKNGGKANGRTESGDEENRNGRPDVAKNLRKLYHSCGFMGNILAKKLKRRIDALTPDTLAQCRLQVKDMTEKLKPLVLELQRKLDDVENVTLSD